MPRFQPFAGIRYDPRRADPGQVTAPPYDVLTEADRAALLACCPLNAVLIDLPIEADGPDRYTAAGATMKAWLDDGTLAVDERPSYTVYRMAYTDDLGRDTATVGVIGALTLSRPGEGDILPHEYTTPKARSDRLDLLRGTRANLSAVWGLSLTAGLTELLPIHDQPLAEWDDDDGVSHTVWRVDDPAPVEAISEAISASPVVIADGHHRYETSLAYRDERRISDGGDAGPAEATMCFVVELVDDQLTVRPIHRLLTGIPARLDLEGELAKWFAPGERVDAAGVASGSVLERMAKAGGLAFVRPDGSAELLLPREGAFDGVADLDSARLVHALDGLPIEHTGIEVHYQHGVDHVVSAMSEARADAGILLRPATVAQIEANAHAGHRMPPKTTFFHPKPKTGIVFRSLD